MPLQDERNILHIGPLPRPGHAEVTPAMADAVRERIIAAGGKLTVWAVLHDDLYDSPIYSDDDDPGDVVLSLRGIALNSVDAERLAALGPASQFSRLIVKGYRLGLKDDLPAIMNPFADLAGFSINDVVEILCEIPKGGTASRLLTGSGRRSDGPLLSLP
ncbi:MAG: hypothetical protein WBX11_04810 [Thiobacillaceae bacterium]